MANVPELTSAEPRRAFAEERRASVIQRFRELVESQTMPDDDEKLLFMPDFACALGVSERMLRLCCQEHLGMGPGRFLFTRRMQMAQMALRQSLPNDTVTEIATRFGFWHLGRFAGSYHSLFGESPSTTLRQRSSTASRASQDRELRPDAADGDHALRSD